MLQNFEMLELELNFHQCMVDKTQTDGGYVMCTKFMIGLQKYVFHILACCHFNLIGLTHGRNILKICLNYFKRETDCFGVTYSI
jgi:hypothetical protein